MKGRRYAALLLLGSASLWSQEDHQRVAAHKHEDWALQVQSGWSWAPDLEGLAQGQLTGGFSCRLLEVLEVGVRGSLTPEQGRYGLQARALGQSANTRSHLTVNWAHEEGFSGGGGLSWILDPVVLSADLTVSHADDFWYGLQLTLSEVLNDQVSWQLLLLPSFGPRAEGVWAGTLAVQVAVGWYSGPWSLENGVALAGWSLQQTGGVGWRSDG
jgi:hypothetical protein